MNSKITTQLPRLATSALVLLVCVNITTMIHNLNERYQKNRGQASAFFGDKFASALPLIRNEKYVSYYTNRTLEGQDIRPIAQFYQAQLMLAPVILDANNLNHRFVIIDCDTPQQAKAAINALHVRPIHVDPQGVILAVKITGAS